MRIFKMHYDYRNDFPLLMQNKIIYIDNAATSQRPQCVIDAEGDFYKNYNANPLRGLYSLSVEATEVYENAREEKPYAASSTRHARRK